jgi:hypothetical protein
VRDADRGLSKIDSEFAVANREVDKHRRPYYAAEEEMRRADKAHEAARAGR